MLPLLDARYVGYNADMLALYAHGVRPRPAARRTAYFRALLQLQSHPILFDEESPQFRLQFDLDDPVARDGLFILLDGNRLDYRVVRARRKPTRISEDVRQAERLLYRYSASAYTSLHLVVGSVIVASLPLVTGRAPGTGISSARSGCSPQPDWTPMDFAEILLHEGLHQSIFLDDLVNRTFELTPQAFDDPRFLVQSPSRRTARPYDLAFHSALVVTALAEFYAALDVARPTQLDASVQLLPTTVGQLRAKDEVLSEHGRCLLALMESEITRLPAIARREAVRVL